MHFAILIACAVLTSSAYNPMAYCVWTRGLLLMTIAYLCFNLFKQVLRQSRLYESAPAYVTDQPRFVNGALAALTTLQPLELLDALKSVEVTSKHTLMLGCLYGHPPPPADSAVHDGF